MSFLTTLVSAFKGGGGAHSHVPLQRNFVSPWSAAYDSAPRLPQFDYASAVREGYLANPVAQRSVRIVAEGVGGAPLASDDPALEKLVTRSCGTTPLLEVLASQLLLHGKPSPASTPWCNLSLSTNCRSRLLTRRRAPVISCPHPPAASGPGTTARWRFGPRANGFTSIHAKARASTTRRAAR